MPVASRTVRSMISAASSTRWISPTDCPANGTYWCPPPARTEATIAGLSFAGSGGELVAVSCPLPGERGGQHLATSGCRWVVRTVVGREQPVEEVVVHGVGRGRLDLGGSRLDHEPNPGGHGSLAASRARGAYRPWTTATSGEMVRT